MTVPFPDPPARREEASGDAFAATVAEELPDSGDPEALPGAIPVDDRSLQSLPTIGHVGRYALKYELGAGGLGTVYAALDPLLSRPIAVKTLHVDAIAEQRDALETRLLAEARAAAGLNHPHIVTVFDAGLSEQGVYIAMERLQGRDLRHLLADGWRPEPAQAARIAMRIADALAYAHGHGVIHCDIKPANIYMIGRTQPKVLDFGIARVAHQQGQPAADAVPVDLQAGMSLPGNPHGDPRDAQHEGAPTSVPAVEFGSPYYVSPEQQRGEPLDLRCDVYGVGVVLYELLTGQRAFQGRTLESIRHAVLEGEVPMAHVVNRNVNGELVSHRRPRHGAQPGAALPLGPPTHTRAAWLARRRCQPRGCRAAGQVELGLGGLCRPRAGDGRRLLARGHVARCAAERAGNPGARRSHAGASRGRTTDDCGAERRRRATRDHGRGPQAAQGRSRRRDRTCTRSPARPARGRRRWNRSSRHRCRSWARCSWPSAPGARSRSTVSPRARRRRCRN